MNRPLHSAIAVIGMAGRFPDACDIREFWRNLECGRESLVDFSAAELLEAGVDPELLRSPQYVKRGTVLEGADQFDAGFFGFSPREAELMDPQHRMFLECVWHALEDAGYAGDQVPGPIGVYAGAGINTYLFDSLLKNPEVLKAAGGYQVMLGNDKDFLATRVSYKLNLKGPSLTLQTACSTSLVAVQIACQALLANECRMALAGGVSLHFPQRSGHLHEDGMIFSADGHCRPFDANASGIRAGQGAGVVLLKRLDDALNDGDSIRAIIRGAAINNDGSGKMGYTTPSIEGQAEAITTALRKAGVDPSTISYVEAHGTATRIGDPIEIAALTRVFREYTDKTQFCAIGSVKSNIGHLDTAAGVAGLIKTVLALQHRQIPPSLGFQAPNPLIDFAQSPFYVNDKLNSWPSETPRRAAVSSFGIGGTNAHVVLEESPDAEPSSANWPANLLVLSAKTPSALEKLIRQTGDYLRESPAVSLPDVCYTLQVGRKMFSHRRAVVCSTREEAIDSLAGPGPDSRKSSADLSARRVTFMFSGQGSQYAGMARGLYRTQPTFRRWFNTCAEFLRTPLGCDLREKLYEPAADDGSLNQTWLTQAALFTLEYSLARTWMSWGVRPDSMIGHSIGEYTAACLADVFSLEDALHLVMERGRLMHQMPAGSMLAVPLPHEQLGGLLNGSLSIAAVNTPSLCTISGPDAAIQSLKARLQVSGVECRHLRTSHAFHSAMMEGALEPYLDCFHNVKLQPPRIPFVSNLTGEWIRPEEATDPSYWAGHLRHTVRFAEGIRALATATGRVFLEVGPGQTLSTFTREATRGVAGCETFASLPQPKDSQSDLPFILNTVGRLWQSGVPIDWAALHEGERLHRVSLPAYPFERQRFWVLPQRSASPLANTADADQRKALDDWFYVPSWTRSAPPLALEAPVPPARWLIFTDRSELSEQVVQMLAARNELAITVEAAEAFARNNSGAFTLNPSRPEDYSRLLSELEAAGSFPRSILFLWGLPNALAGGPRAAFHALLRLAQCLGARNLHGPLDWIIVSSGMHDVLGGEVTDPLQALLSGPAKVIPREIANLVCRSVDIPAPVPSTDRLSRIAENLLREPSMPDQFTPVAYRAGARWTQTYLPVRLPARERTCLRQRGTYLITGGTGGIGLTLAEYLAAQFHAQLVLTCRTEIPPRPEWKRWLDSHSETDRVSGILRDAERLEKLGAEVLLLTADVADADAMNRVFGAVHERFGPIHGVIHAAGIATGGLVQLKTPEAAEKVMAPKVAGTLVLDALLASDPLDFLVLCSSINAICGVAGAVDYTAANAFLDAFAASRHGKTRAIVSSVNWDSWQQVGMAANTVLPADMVESWKKKLAEGIAPADGVQAFLRVLGAGLPQIAVVTHDLPRIIERSAAPVLWPSSTAGSPAPSSEEDSGSRLQLHTIAGESAGGTKKEIAAIWTELLGIDEIGLDDNFFELGGHSLLATRVLSRIRNAFGLAIPLQVVFEAPTIRLLADHVETLLWATAKPCVDESEVREEIEL